MTKMMNIRSVGDSVLRGGGGADNELTIIKHFLNTKKIYQYSQVILFSQHITPKTCGPCVYTRHTCIIHLAVHYLISNMYLPSYIKLISYS